MYRIKTSKIPEELNGLKIVHLSDIHRKTFGKNQKRLISLIKKENPDLIVVSGDIIYCYSHRYNFNFSYSKDLKKVMALFDELVKYYPVFYAPGNHECKSGYYEEIKKSLVKCGVNVLDDTYTYYDKNNSKIGIIGLKDPTFYGGTNEVKDDYISKTESRLLVLAKDVGSQFTVLISHRPEIHNIYQKSKVDIVFSGHAHGGQWRLPFIGPLYAPGQGRFPKYTSGVHLFGCTNLVISRGLGNSSFPIRLFNRPDVVVAVIEKE